jgi:hypothetical protein
MAFGRRVRTVISEGESMMAMPPTSRFIRQLLRNATIALGVIGVGLVIGMTGYHSLGSMTWQEAFYYASMILSGEGPPPDPTPLTALALAHLHLFAGFYALFSGVTFITTIGVLLAPAVHRFLHRFHLELYAHDDTAA